MKSVMRRSARERKHEEAVQFSMDLNDYIKREFYYKKNFSSVDKLSHTISVRSIRVDLYLRYKAEHYPGKNIVIARMAFAEQRKGRGQNFLGFLVNIADRHDFNCIVIESANDISSSFAQKHGFSRFGSSDAGHYICSVADLRRSFPPFIHTNSI